MELGMKTLVRLLLVTIFIVTNTAMAFTAAPEENKNDIRIHEENAPGNNAIEFLNKLGIPIDKNQEHHPEKEMTRGELAEIIAMCVALEDTVIQIDTRFSDVTKNHPKSGYISAIVSMGIMQGITDDKFAPDEKVTYNQTVKAIVNVLGYGMYAGGSGGYPAGWIAVASQLGVLKNTRLAGEEPIKLSVMAQLFKNVMEIDIMIRTGYGDDAKYEAHKGRTVLTEYLDVEKVEGQITANYYTTLVGESKLKEDEVQVDETIFKIGETNADLFLGRYITMYVKDIHKTEWGKTILLIEEKSKENNTLVIDANEILPKTNVSSLYYNTENNKVNIADISAGAYLIYNGKAKIAWSEKDLKPEYGDVTLIDLYGNGTYDVIFIYDYKNIVIENADIINNIIYYKNQADEWRSLNINPDDSDIKVSFINKDGSKANIEDCTQWNVLTVAKSEDEKVIKIIRNEETITGVISEIGDKEVVISDKTYGIAPNFSKDLLELDREGFFYQDYRGAIAAVKYGAQAGKKYGYLVNIKIKSGIDNILQFKIFTDRGIMSVFEGAQRLLFNNKLLTDASSILDSTLICINGNVVRQLVLYELDNEGRLKFLETAKDGNKMSREERLSQFTIDGEWGVIRYWPLTMGMIASRYLVRNEIKIFVIPFSDMGDDSLYNVFIASDLRSQNYRNVSIYDVTKDNRILAMVIEREEAAFISSNSARGVVTKVTKGVDELGNPITNLYLFTDGQEQAFRADEMLMARFNTTIADMERENEIVVDEQGNKTLKDCIPLGKLNAGDIVQYSAIFGNSIDALRVLFRANAPVETERLGSGTLDADNNFASLYYAYGAVDDILADGIRMYVPVQIKGAQTYERVYVFGSATIVEFEANTGKAKAITRDDIMPGDKVFVNNYDRYPSLFVVYR